jgi:hypothetical protein
MPYVPVEQRLEVEKETRRIIDPKKFWKPETRKKAEELVDVAEEVTSRCYFPGIIFGTEEEMREKVLLWKKRLEELIEEVKSYG